MDPTGWLQSIGLERYTAAFRENEIDEAVLPDLTAEDLKDIGVGPIGHRRKLLDAIAALLTDAGGDVSGKAQSGIEPRVARFRRAPASYRNVR
jgi:hypothetical protein